MTATVTVGGATPAAAACAAAACCSCPCSWAATPASAWAATGLAADEVSTSGCWPEHDRAVDLALLDRGDGGVAVIDGRDVEDAGRVLLDAADELFELGRGAGGGERQVVHLGGERGPEERQHDDRDGGQRDGDRDDARPRSGTGGEEA